MPVKHWSNAAFVTLGNMVNRSSQSFHYHFQVVFTSEKLRNFNLSHLSHFASSDHVDAMLEVYITQSALKSAINVDKNLLIVRTDDEIRLG